MAHVQLPCGFAINGAQEVHQDSFNWRSVGLLDCLSGVCHFWLTSSSRPTIPTDVCEFVNKMIFSHANQLSLMLCGTEGRFQEHIDGKLTAGPNTNHRTDKSCHRWLHAGKSTENTPVAPVLTADFPHHRRDDLLRWCSSRRGLHEMSRKYFATLWFNRESEFSAKFLRTPRTSPTG